MLNDVIFWSLGAACMAWTVGLVVCVAYLDRSQRSATTKAMGDALRSIIERTGELRRTKSGDANVVGL